MASIRGSYPNRGERNNIAGRTGFGRYCSFDTTQGWVEKGRRSPA
jgi:hypothetical protein